MSTPATDPATNHRTTATTPVTITGHHHPRQQARGSKAPAPAVTQVDGAATAPSRETHPTLR